MLNLIKLMVILIPMTASLSMIYMAYSQSGDWIFFTGKGYESDPNYPSASLWLIQHLEMLMNEKTVGLSIGLLTSLWIPCILIILITNSHKASFFYSYFSGIPVFLIMHGNVSQMLIQVMMLISLLNPLGMAVFALIGANIHREWAAALLLCIAFKLYRGIVKNEPNLRIV